MNIITISSYFVRLKSFAWLCLTYVWPLSHNFYYAIVNEDFPLRFVALNTQTLLYAAASCDKGINRIRPYFLVNMSTVSNGTASHSSVYQIPRSIAGPNPYNLFIFTIDYSWNFTTRSLLSLEHVAMFVVNCVVLQIIGLVVPNNITHYNVCVFFFVIHMNGQVYGSINHVQLTIHIVSKMISSRLSFITDKWTGQKGVGWLFAEMCICIIWVKVLYVPDLCSTIVDSIYLYHVYLYHTKTWVCVINKKCTFSSLWRVRCKYSCSVTYVSCPLQIVTSHVVRHLHIYLYIFLWGRFVTHET